MEQLSISNNLFLTKINVTDHKKLYKLMCEIYPPAYKHLWPDEGEWYLNTLYLKNNLVKELNDTHARYYFVYYKKKLVGILRVILNNSLLGVNNQQTKLHRIYLAPSVQGKGLGKEIVAWVENQFCTKNKSILWLEVMDTQDAAINFYKKLGFKIVSSFTLQYELMYKNVKGMYRMSKEIV